MPFEAIMINPDALPDYIEVGTDIRRGKPYAMDRVSTDGDEGAIFGTITLDSGNTYHLHGFTKPSEGTAFIVKRVYTTDESETDPVLKVWGRYADIDAWDKKDNRLFNWLEGILQYSSPTSYKDHNQFRFAWRLSAFQPFRSQKFDGKISLYQSVKDREQDREVAMKPGRAISLMFPELSDTEVDSMVDKYLREFVQRDFTVHIGHTKDDFSHAYSGEQAPMENISTTFSHKSMSNSCMRYKTNPDCNESTQFSGFPMHPASAYASGDFKIFYTEDDKGLIGSRCTVYVKNGSYRAGPIYGTTEQSIDMIRTKLKECDPDYTLCESGAWEGAKLLRVEYRSGYIAPYIDLSPQALTDDGDNLVIQHGGEIDASNYSGILENGCGCCHECGETVYEDDVRHSEYTGHQYCEECFYEEHFYCEYIHEDCHERESVMVYSQCRWGIDQNSYHESIVGDGEAVEDNGGNLWRTEDCSYCEYDNTWISPHTDDEYFVSDGDCEWYPNDQAAALSFSGDVLSIDEAKGLGYILNDKTNEWEEGDNE